MDEEMMDDYVCATCVFNTSDDEDVAYCIVHMKEVPIDSICDDYEDGDRGDLHHVW